MTAPLVNRSTGLGFGSSHHRYFQILLGDLAGSRAVQSQVANLRETSPPVTRDHAGGTHLPASKGGTEGRAGAGSSAVTFKAQLA